MTRWSRFDNRFEGVLFTEVMKLVTPKPEARFAIVRAEHGYTANLPLADLMKPTTMFAFKHDGEPLSAEHGYPVRLLVPHLYLWKSVKWVRGFELVAEDTPGFWEQNGYHMRGDPWKEQRYDSGLERIEAIRVLCAKTARQLPPRLMNTRTSRNWPLISLPARLPLMAS